MLPADVPEEICKRLAVRSVVNPCEIAFLAIDELTDDERRTMPEVWLQALQQSGRDGIQLMLEHWNRSSRGHYRHSPAVFGKPVLT